MKIASWNVNSLKVRLPHLLDWLAEQRAIWEARTDRLEAYVATLMKAQSK